MKRGQRIQLILFSEFIPDLSNYLSWMRDPDSNPYISGTSRDYSISELLSYINEKSSSPYIRFWGIYTETSLHIGTIKLEPINFEEKTAWLGVLIGDTDSRGKGYGRDSINYVINYARNVLGLERIFLGVDTSNSSAYGLYRKLGFVDSNREGSSVIMTLTL